MNAKKILCLLLALAMIFTLTACGGNNDGNSGNSGNTGNNSTPVANNNDNDGDAQTEFRVAIMRYSEAWGLDFSQTAFLREASEATGATINWETYYAADWAEQKSLLLAGGNLPDAFFGSVCLTDSDISKNKASFWELTALIEENMPNLTRILGEDEMMKSLCTDANGDIYTLPKKLPLRPITANQMFINKDFLDALNMEMPQTYEDLADFMIACGTQDPDGNGEDDTYGQSIVASLQSDLNNLLVYFGLSNSRNKNYMGLDASGTPYFIPASEKYKEAVKWANYLYTNGALDPERFTQDNSLAQAKVQAEGGSKVGVHWQWSVDAETGGNASQFVLCEAVEGPDGERYVETDPTSLNYGRNEFIITKTCTNPGLLLKWADYFYTDLASLQNYYGSIGDGKIAENADGTYEVLVPEDGSSLDASSWINSFRDHGPKYMEVAFESKVVLPTDQGDGVKLAANEVDKAHAHEIFPVCSYSDEQLETLTLLTTDIYNYVETTYANWVINGGIDEEWDAYLQQLQAMQLDKVVEIQTDAYNLTMGR
ncbi:MAG: extracellular solute-binding protein [Acutalibacter sp.]|nr:extracellular solute-binding protein [Acutalibacter sp.]